MTDGWTIHGQRPLPKVPDDRFEEWRSAVHDLVAERWDRYDDDAFFRYDCRREAMRRIGLIP